MSEKTAYKLSELVETDPLAKAKGVVWLREQIKQGKLVAYNTGTESRKAYYVDHDEWARFKEQLKTQ